jgi:hypothetical protein
MATAWQYCCRMGTQDPRGNAAATRVLGDKRCHGSTKYSDAGDAQRTAKMWRRRWVPLLVRREGGGATTCHFANPIRADFYVSGEVRKVSWLTVEGDLCS